MFFLKRASHNEIGFSVNTSDVFSLETFFARQAVENS